MGNVQPSSRAHVCNLHHIWAKQWKTKLSCHNPNLALVTKARAWKGVGQKCNLKITFTLLKVWKTLREWTHTPPSGLPLWEFESLLSPKSSKSDLKGQNSLNWGLPYTIEKFLRLKCLKWVCMIHLKVYNTSYGWKKGWESECQIDS
jgi:hypothetical protein